MALLSTLWNDFLNKREETAKLASKAHTTQTVEAIKKNNTPGAYRNDWEHHDMRNPETQKQATVAAKNKANEELKQRWQQYTADAVDKKYNQDITSQLQGDMNLAIVNNHSVDKGTRLTRFGYLESHAEGLADGTVIRVDNNGNYWEMETDDMSEDYAAQIKSYKDDYNRAKDKFELARKFQDMAKEGQELADPEDRNKTWDGIVDTIVNVGHQADTDTKAILNAINPFDDKHVTFEEFCNELNEDNAEIKQAFAGAVLSKKLPQFVQDKMVTDDYSELYAVDPMKAMKKLYADDTMSDTLKSYTAYKMMQKSHEDSVVDYIKGGAVNTLMILGEDMDYAANQVKATVQYIDYHLDNNADLNKGMNKYFAGKSYDDVIDACYRATWENEGRISYNYNTGFVPFDFALEMLSDPETWFTLGAKVAARSAAKDIAGKATAELGEDVSTKSIKAVLKRATLDGMDDAEIIERVLKNMPVDAQAGMRGVLADALETSKAWKMSKSLGEAVAVKNSVDKLMLWGTGLPLGGKVVKKAVDAITSSTRLGKVDISNILADAATETVGHAGGNNVTIDCANEFFDRVKKNTLAACLDDLLPEYTDIIPQEQKLEFIREFYHNDLQKVYTDTKDYFKTSGIHVDDIRTSEIYAMNKSALDKKTLRVLEMQQLEDTPMYKVLSAKGYAPISFADVNAETYLKESRALMEDSGAIRNMAEDLKEGLAKDVADLSMPAGSEDAKLYVTKMNERTLGEAWMADTTVRSIVHAASNGDYGALAVAASDSTSGIAKVTRELLKSDIGSQNYVRITNTINSLDISDHQKKVLSDVLYNNKLKNRAAQIFASGAEFNDDYTYKIARGYVKAMEEETLALEGWYSGLDKMTDWGCNTYDVSKNVDNIRDIVYKDGKLNVPGYGAYDRAVVYSTAISSDGEFQHIALLLPDGSKVIAHNAQEIDDALLELMTSRSKTSPIHLVSFNNHSQGFDTDNWLRRYLMNKDCHAKQWFTNTDDIASYLRAGAGDFDMFNDEMTDKLEQAIYDSIRSWKEQSLLLGDAGLTARCSFTPPSYKDISRWQEVLADTTTNTATEKSLYDTLAPAVTNYINLDKEASLTMRKATDGAFRGFENMGAYAANPNVGLKAVYDYKTISRWFDVDDLTVQQAMQYYDDAQHILTLRKMQWNQELLYHFKDDIHALYVNVTKDVDVRFKAEGYQDEMAVLCHIYKKDKAAVYKHYNTSFVARILDTKYNMVEHNSAIDILENQDRYLLKPYLIQTAEEVKPGEWKHIDELLPGAIDNPYASYNQLNAIAKDAEELDKTFDTIREYDNWRERKGFIREGQVEDIKRRDKLMDGYYQLKEELRDMMEQEYAYHHSEAIADAKEHGSAVELYMAHGFSPRGMDELNKDMVHWYTDKANFTLTYLNKLNDDEFESYIAYHCHGRMVINNELLTDADKAMLSARPHVVINEGERFTTLRYTEDLDKWYDIGDLCPESSDWYKCNTKLPNGCTESMMTLARYNDASFKIGLPLANDEGMYTFINNKFFKGEPMPEFKRTSDYLCGYIGNIYDILGEGSYASGNVYSNLFNSYARTIQKFEMNKMYIDLVFDGRTLKDYCGESKLEDVLDGLAQLDKRIAVRDGNTIRYGNFTAAELAKFMDKEVFVCDNIEMKNFIDDIKAVRQGTVTEEIMKYLKRARGVESKWIKGYLYINPGTWMHNWVDSTTKAVLSEGCDHFKYMCEALSTVKTFDEVLKDAGAEFGKRPGKITLDDLEKFLARKGDKAYNISDKRIKQIYMYKQSSISGTMFSDAILEEAEAGLLKFNKHMFDTCEATNRLAIYLKHMDEGDTIGQAYEAIKLSQFDYAKNYALTMADTLMPFSTFKLYNYKFWMHDVWQQTGAARSIKALTSIYNKDGISDRYDNYWSEEAMDYRAWIDTLDFDRTNRAKNYEYDSFEDYMGSTKDIADDNGWIKIDGKMYFKLGLSLVEGMGALNFIADADSAMFSPAHSLMNCVKYVLEHGDDLEPGQAFEDCKADLMEMVPVLGTAYTLGTQMYRNYKLYDRLNETGSISCFLATILPGWFAPGDYKEPKDYSMSKPIGYNWYDLSDEQKKLYQYVNGVSYTKSWIAKDPATYINHWGRLQQMTGFDNDQMQDFMELAGGFWFTQNNEGAYQLHNYKLMCGDEEMRNTLFAKLTGTFGWSAAKANELLDAASISMWKQRSYKGNGQFHASNGSRALRYGYGRYKGISSSNLVKGPVTGKGKYTIHPKPRMMSDNLSAGKNVNLSKYAQQRLRQGRPVRMNRVERNNYRWHRRTRDIYKNNYAKYGASRMAMEQNLKNYSNRSITEMRRTNQSLRYNDIHRHVSW